MSVGASSNGSDSESATKAAIQAHRTAFAPARASPTREVAAPREEPEEIAASAQPTATRRRAVRMPLIVVADNIYLHRRRSASESESRNSLRMIGPCLAIDRLVRIPSLVSALATTISSLPSPSAYTNAAPDPPCRRDASRCRRGLPRATRQLGRGDLPHIRARASRCARMGEARPRRQGRPASVLRTTAVRIHPPALASSAVQR